MVDADAESPQQDDLTWLRGSGSGQSQLRIGLVLVLWVTQHLASGELRLLQDLGMYRVKIADQDVR